MTTMYMSSGPGIWDRPKGLAEKGFADTTSRSILEVLVEGFWGISRGIIPCKLTVLLFLVSIAMQIGAWSDEAGLGNWGGVNAVCIPR